MEPGGLLERARTSAGLTQDELARRAGTSRTTLSAYEAPPAFRTPGFMVILRGGRHFPELVHDLLRGPVSECGVKTLPIIAQLDVARDVFRCFPACRVDGAVDALDFQCSVERFGESIVVAYSSPTH